MKTILLLLFVLITVILYSPAVHGQAPNPTWEKRIGCNDLQDYISDMAIDANNTIFLTGITKKSSTEYDYLTLKMNSDGTITRVDTIDPGTVDQSQSISVGGGYLYVTGKSKQGSYYYAETVSYDTSTLYRRFLKRYSGGAQNDQALVVRVGTTGEPFIAGNAKFTSTNPDIFVLKYSLDGNTTTSSQFDVSGNNKDYLTTMDIDGNNNIYMTGSTGSLPYWFLVKYNSSIVRGWTTITSFLNIGSTPYAMDLDTSGNIYVTGGWTGNPPYIPLNVYKQSDGSQVASLQYWTPDQQGWARGLGITVIKTDKTIYLTGETPERINGADWARVFIAKFVYSGTAWSQAWSATYGWGSGEVALSGRKVAVTTNGDVYVAGIAKVDGSYTGVMGDYPDLLLLKYNSSGTLIWDKLIDGEINGGKDTLTAVAVDGSGGLYLAGASKGTVLSQSYTDWPDNSDMQIYKFNTGSNFILGTISTRNQSIIEETTPSTWQLSQNYPNPFNPTSVIRFSLKEPTTVNLKVYDLLGREVKTIINDMHYETGEHEVKLNAQDLPSGVYFYRVITGDHKFIDVKKMLLIK